MAAAPAFVPPLAGRAPARRRRLLVALSPRVLAGVAALGFPLRLPLAAPSGVSAAAFAPFAALLASWSP
ncbi:mycobacterial-type methylenetetrahydrofolate reductase, partial [Mycobacterium tuberculosis]|uniref:mycobacterial-type methylenetetrahydrofolate reductase n=1 Tax=Mycobacterium tuberculosis TaxID=1773 RepID=UPI0023506267